MTDLPRIAGVEPYAAGAGWGVEPYASGAGWAVYCADSVALLAAGALPGGCAIVTDPPYGIGYQHAGGGNGWQQRIGKTITRTGQDAHIIGDSAAFDPRPWLDYAGAVAGKRGNKTTPASMRIALCGADHYAARLPDGVGCLLCWDKCEGGGPEDSFTDAEYIWVGTKTARRIYRHQWKGRLRRGESAARHHVSEKPVGLMAWLMDRNRIPYHMPILDPYAGSGTTGVAALRQGRQCILIEIDPDYCAIAAARLRAAEAGP